MKDDKLRPVTYIHGRQIAGGIICATCIGALCFTSVGGVGQVGLLIMAWWSFSTARG